MIDCHCVPYGAILAFKRTNGNSFSMLGNLQDPHPGNLLAMSTGELCYLDFGVMSSAPENARYAIIAHVVHLVNRDYQAMAKDYYDLEFLDPSVDTSPLVPALANFFDSGVIDMGVDQLNFKALVDGLGEIFFQYPFRVPPYWALVLRSLTVLEGLAIYSDPEYKLLAKAYPYMAQRLLTDPEPTLRRSLEELVVKDGRFDVDRFEGLIENSKKSQSYDTEGFWLFLEWFLSPEGHRVREAFSKELAILVDDASYANTRNMIRNALKLVLPAEEVESAVDSYLKLRKQESEKADQFARLFESAAEILVPNTADTFGGTLDPEKVLKFFQNSTSLEQRKRLRMLAQHSDALNELATSISTEVLTRFVARITKLGLQVSEPTTGKAGKK